MEQTLASIPEGHPAQGQGGAHSGVGMGDSPLATDQSKVRPNDDTGVNWKWYDATITRRAGWWANVNGTWY